MRLDCVPQFVYSLVHLVSSRFIYLVLYNITSCHHISSYRTYRILLFSTKNDLVATHQSIHVHYRWNLHDMNSRSASIDYNCTHDRKLTTKTTTVHSGGRIQIPSRTQDRHRCLHGHLPVSDCRPQRWTEPAGHDAHQRRWRDHESHTGNVQSNQSLFVRGFEARLCL